MMKAMFDTGMPKRKVRSTLKAAIGRLKRNRSTNDGKMKSYFDQQTPTLLYGIMSCEYGFTFTVEEFEAILKGKDSKDGGNKIQTQFTADYIKTFCNRCSWNVESTGNDNRPFKGLLWRHEYDDDYYYEVIKLKYNWNYSEQSSKEIRNLLTHVVRDVNETQRNVSQIYERVFNPK